jgi:polyhydroxyalkanoate synthesis regulator protein
MNKKSLIILSLIILSAFFMSSCSEDDKTTAFNKIKSKLAIQENKAVLVKPIFDEQTDKISAILEKAMNSRPEMIKGGMPSFQPSDRPVSFESGQGKAQNPLAEKLRPVNEDANAKLSTILTIDQIDEYDNIINEWIEKMMSKNKPEDKGGRMGGGHPSGGMGGGPSGRPQW